MGRHRSWGTIAAVAMSALALLISVGGVALGQEGSDLFSDIASSPFREEINRIGRAGCASGFPDGTFQPHGNVNRQQFAFWTNNCGGRVGYDAGTVFIPGDGEDVMASVGIRAGATDSGVSEGGFVLVIGTAHVKTDQAGCPCQVEVWIREHSGSTDSAFRDTLLPVNTGPPSQSSAALSVTGVFPVGPETDTLFTFRGLSNGPGNPTIEFTGELVALYVPFGADGDRSLNTSP
jgi:S-layer homology domain